MMTGSTPILGNLYIETATSHTRGAQPFPSVSFLPCLRRRVSENQSLSQLPGPSAPLFQPVAILDH